MPPVIFASSYTFSSRTDRPGVVQIPAQGGEPSFIDGPPDADPFQVSISPDGTRVAYYNRTPPSVELWSMNIAAVALKGRLGQ